MNLFLPSRYSTVEVISKQLEYDTRVTYQRKQYCFKFKTLLIFLSGHRFNFQIYLAVYAVFHRLCYKL